MKTTSIICDNCLKTRFETISLDIYRNTTVDPSVGAQDNYVALDFCKDCLDDIISEILHDESLILKINSMKISKL